MKTLISFLLFTVAYSAAFSIPCANFLQVNLKGDTVPKDLVVPPFTLIGSMVDDDILNNIEIEHTGIAEKGYGAFAKGTIASHSFLGFYQGRRYPSKEKLDEVMTERVQQIQEMGDEGKYIYPMDYVISQDGGTTWIDGFDRAQVRYYFEPVHLNHADEGADKCNVIRILEDDRIAFFTSRDILEGEELAFNYGQEFWEGRKEMKF